MDNMNFRIQDLTKTLIPGIILLVLSLCWILSIEDLKSILNLIKDTTGIFLVIFLIIVYVIGYFVDFIGSQFEYLYYRLEPKPSYYLLNDFSENYRIKMSKKEDIKEYLCDKLRISTVPHLNDEQAEKLFKMANLLKESSVNQTSKEKVSEFYFSKIFSRNLCTSLILSLIIYYICTFSSYNPQAILNINSWVFLIIILAYLSFLRWKQHAKYYSRQVFYTACESILRP